MEGAVEWLRARSYLSAEGWQEITAISNLLDELHQEATLSEQRAEGSDRPTADAYFIVAFLRRVGTFLGARHALFDVLRVIAKERETSAGTLAGLRLARSLLLSLKASPTLAVGKAIDLEEAAIRGGKEGAEMKRDKHAEDYAKRERQLREALRVGKPAKEIARILGVSRARVYQLINEIPKTPPS